MQNTKRLFAAIKIHPSERFLMVYNHIKSSLRQEHITWVNPAVMHLTIKFFGETPVDQIPAVNKCLKEAVREIQYFELEVKNTGMFGSRYKPRVIWFGIDAGNDLQILFKSVSDALKGIGILPDRQHFVPHLTIGRIKEIKNMQNFQAVLEQYRNHESGRQTINEMILYESLLRREGPIYKHVEVFGFGEKA